MIGPGLSWLGTDYVCRGLFEQEAFAEVMDGPDVLKSKLANLKTGVSFVKVILQTCIQEKATCLNAQLSSKQQSQTLLASGLFRCLSSPVIQLSNKLANCETGN